MISRCLGVVIAAGLAVGLGLAAGCASDGGGGAMADSMQESQVLQAAYADSLADAVNSRREAGEELAADYQTADFVLESIDIQRMKFPSLFSVTPAQEADFRNGRFNDAMNRTTFEEALAKLQEQRVPLDSVTGELARRYADGGLSGAKLELAARLAKSLLEAVVVSDMQGSV